MPKTLLYVKNHDFGTPFGFPGDPKSALGPPIFSQKIDFELPGVRAETLRGPTWPRPGAENAPDRIFIDFYRFLMDFLPILLVLGSVLAPF